MPLLLANFVRKGKASESETLMHRRSNTTIKTPTPDASMRQRENLHQAAQGLPPLEKGLVAEGPNEAPNSQGCNQHV